jgi:GNAT superfamily N-acetyltransferase
MLRSISMSQSSVLVRSFRPGDEAAFRALNEAWITRLFRLEDKDRVTLGDPQRYVLDPGGRILMAVLDELAVGCCALLRLDAATVELGKMAVDLAHQGRGIGRLLMIEAVAQARHMNARSIYLETNSSLKPAIALYESFGFRPVPIDKARAITFDRVDLPMELVL